MAVPTVYGQTLVDLANDLLAGYQNGVGSRELLTYLNLAKDEVWAVTKELHDEYFQVFSQSTNASADYYFAPLNTTTRNYTLPADLRSIEFIECTTAGFEGTTFTYAKLNSPQFREERQASNQANAADPNNNVQTYTYSIAGKNQFVMAAYPAAALTLVLWYTRALPDFEASDVIDEILFPFSKKLAEFAAKRVMLADQDAGQFAAWKSEWRDSLINLVQSSGSRNDADPQFVQDFYGEDC
jgi:hypothetical protein